MTKTENQIVEDVKILLDEIADNEGEWLIPNSGTDTEDNIHMTTIIKNRIAQAIDFVHGNAQLDLMALDETEFIRKTATYVDTPITIDLADAEEEYFPLLRLVYADSDSWPYKVTHFATDEEEKYVKDPFIGASWERPMVVKDGSKITLYTIEAGGDTADLKYLPRAYKRTLTSQQEVWGIDSNMYEAVKWYLAFLVSVVYGEQRGDDMLNMALSIMGIATKPEQAQ